LHALQFQQRGICLKFPGGTSISHYWSNECFVQVTKLTCSSYNTPTRTANKIAILFAVQLFLRDPHSKQHSSKFACS
jgi:hypothetical protein